MGWKYLRPTDALIEELVSSGVALDEDELRRDLARRDGDKDALRIVRDGKGRLTVQAPWLFGL